MSRTSLWGARGGSAALLLSVGLTQLPAVATAFCGFFVSGADAQLYNSASQVALLRKGNHTVMTMSNTYKGPPEDFAMVVPVPVVLQKEQVKTLAPEVFQHIDQLSAPRLVEYWEQDPCSPPEPPMALGMAKRAPMPSRKKMAGPGADLGVTIEAQFTVGEYQVLILSAKDSSGLDRWLRLNKYKIPDGAAAALAPYIRDQMKFFVAKVDIQKVRRDDHGQVVLSPLRFAFDAAELRLPVRLGLLNAESKQDLIVYILHPESRFEVANYANVFVPTNLEVADSVRQGFGAFYAQLFDETLQKANNKAVVTEYSWQTSSCDPCPTPPLSAAELYTLGDDQLFPELAAASRDSLPPPSPLMTPAAAPRPSAGARPMSKRRPFFGGGPSWVLTRLHTRYDKSSLTEDLIFRSAKPVVGGRSSWNGVALDNGATPTDGGANNFQGRYIIRHDCPAESRRRHNRAEAAARNSCGANDSCAVGRRNRVCHADEHRVRSRSERSARSRYHRRRPEDLAEHGVRPGAPAPDERVFQLRHLVLDDLHPGRGHHVVPARPV